MDRKTNRKILKDLKSSYSKLDKERNMELADQLRTIIRDYNDNQDSFHTAFLLDTACMTEKLPECVISVIRELYLEAAAEEDNANAPMAWNNLAMMYYNGRAGKRDYKEAMRAL